MIKVLQIEDSYEYALLFKTITRKHFDLTVVTSLSDLRSLPAEEIQKFQLIVCDGQLPDGTGMEAIVFLKNKTLAKIIANSSSKEYNKSMLQSGASFALLKKDLLPTKDNFIKKCLQECP